MNQITKVSEEVLSKVVRIRHTFLMNGKEFTISEYDEQDNVNSSYNYDCDFEVSADFTEEEIEIVEENQLELTGLKEGEKLNV